MKKGKWKKIFTGAGMFAVLGMAAKLIGALYRIPLTNVMGAEGIGLYQMVFPLYTVLLTVTSGGLPAAVSKVTAAMNARGDKAAAKKVLWTTLLSVGAFGLLASALLVALRNKIALIQGNGMAALPYLGIAPSIFLVGLISVLRGYYQGSHNMLPSAISQLIEQVVKLAVGLYLCAYFMRFGVEYAVLGAVLGVTASEAVALVGLMLWYGVRAVVAKRKRQIPLLEAAGELTALPQSIEPSRTSVLKAVYKIAVPVTIGALVMPITQVIDSILVINVLSTVFGTAAATTQYGLLNGPVNSLVNMPVVVTAALGAALLPKVSALTAKNDESAPTVARAFRYALLLALPSAGALSVFAAPILTVLYAKSLSPALIALGASLMRFAALSVVYTAFIQISTSVLQGVDRAATPAVNLIVGAIVKVGLTVILLKSIGIFGAVAASVACYGVTAVLDVIALRRRVSFGAKLWRTLLAPLCSTAAACGAGFGVYTLLVGHLSPLVALIVAGIVLVAVYAGLLLLTHAVEIKELRIKNEE